jgi:ATPase subunit of ABC transporter with duplicated ATPase domains
MLFSGEEGLKPTEALSGGETARLLFCRIMLQKPNVLVLDEPTNHLDLESINALNIALQKYEGTVLLVDTRPGRARRSRHARVALHGARDSRTSRGTYEEFAATLA